MAVRRQNKPNKAQENQRKCVKCFLTSIWNVLDHCIEFCLLLLFSILKKQLVKGGHLPLFTFALPWISSSVDLTKNSNTQSCKDHEYLIPIKSHQNQLTDN